MKKRNSIFWGLTASTALALSNPSWAMAAGNFESCTATAASSYSCVSLYGYTGIDPYGVYQYGKKDSNGKWHNCTAYAAYRLSVANPYMPAISNFHDASAWASEAVSLTGATLGSTPKIGDVAWWGASSGLAFGHVAVVDSIAYNSTGSIVSIKVSDDNALRLVTTNRVLYPGTQTGTIRYPDNFIRFPSFPSNGGGGSRPPGIRFAPLGEESTVSE
jgi:surface antigen